MDVEIVREEPAAEIVDLSVSTLQKMRVRGDGPPFLKIGRSVRYRVSDLQAWAASKRVRSTSDQVPA